MDEIEKLAKEYGLDLNNDTGAFAEIKEKKQTLFSSLWFLFICIMFPALLIGFFVYKLVRSLRDKEKAKEEKKKLKLQRKEKEIKKKVKTK